MQANHERGKSPHGHFEPAVLTAPTDQETEQRAQRAQEAQGLDPGARSVVVAEQRHYERGAQTADEAWYNKALAALATAQAKLQKALVRQRLCDAAETKAAETEAKAQTEADDFERALSCASPAEREAAGPATKAPDRSPSGWARRMARTQVHVSSPYYVLLLLCTVLVAFPVDLTAFTEFRLPVSAGGVDPTVALAFGLAIAMPVACHIAGVAFWWAFDPDLPGTHKRRNHLLVWALVLVAGGVTAGLVALRGAYLHQQHVAAPTWALAVFGGGLLAADLVASAAHHNPWVLEARRVAADLNEAKKALGKAKEENARAKDVVLDAQGGYMTAAEAVLDPHVAIVPHLAAAVERLCKLEAGPSATAAVAVGGCRQCPADPYEIWPSWHTPLAAWLHSYNHSTPAPVADAWLGGSAPELGANEQERAKDDTPQASAPAPAPGGPAPAPAQAQEPPAPSVDFEAHEAAGSLNHNGVRR